MSIIYKALCDENGCTQETNATPSGAVYDDKWLTIATTDKAPGVKGYTWQFCSWSHAADFIRRKNEQSGNPHLLYKEPLR